MDISDSFKTDIFKVNNKNFAAIALKVFNYQYSTNEIYRSYCNYLIKSPQNVNYLDQIPFLPIEIFKHHTVKSGNWKETRKFLSSGTTGNERSIHYVRNETFYERVCLEGFERVYGPISNYLILGLLPSYQEQGNSSLIHMVHYFTRLGRNGSGFFLHNSKDLYRVLTNDNTPKILFGVGYALLDFIEKFKNPDTKNCIVIETGGMKGRRKELTKQELHSKLQSGFNVKSIHSEYGMTELFSQAYAAESGKFRAPPWMKVLTREINDPFCYIKKKTGGINVIDLANIDTCSFIETKDLGKTSDSSFFQVLGRFDHSDIRGCNLLIQ